MIKIIAKCMILICSPENKSELKVKDCSEGGPKKMFGIKPIFDIKNNRIKEKTVEIICYVTVQLIYRTKEAK